MVHEPNPQSDGAAKTAETDTRSGGGVGVPGLGGGGAAGRTGALALPALSLALIPNWRKAPRMLTMWVGLAATVFGLMPPDQQLAVLEIFGVSPLKAPAIIGLAFMAARLIDQPKTRGGDA